MHASAARRLIDQLVLHYRAGVAKQDSNSFRKWKQTMAFGAAGLVLLMVLLVQFAKSFEARGGLSWETAFLQQLGKSGPFTFSTAVWYQTFGTDITLIILILLTTGIALWARKPITAWSIVLAYAAIDPVVRIGWLLWDRSRPSVLFEGVAVPAFHSFPSGHTAKTLAVYGILAVVWIRSSNSIVERIAAVIMLASIAIVVPLGRLSMGVHWPSDIIAGWIIGAVWLIVLALGLRLEKH